MKAAGLNDKNLDLMARTAPDEHAITELTDMASQAVAAQQAFTDSLSLHTARG